MKPLFPFLPTSFFIAVAGFITSIEIFKKRYQPPDVVNFTNSYRKIQRFGIIPFSFFIRLLIPSSIRNISCIYLLTRLGLIARKDFLMVPATIFVCRAFSLFIFVCITKIFFFPGFMIPIGIVGLLILASMIGGRIWAIQYSGKSMEDRGVWGFLMSLFFWGQIVCLWSFWLPKFPWLSPYQYPIAIVSLLILRFFSSSIIIHTLIVIFLTQTQIISHSNVWLVMILLLYFGDYLYLQYKHRDYLITLGCFPFLIFLSIVSSMIFLLNWNPFISPSSSPANKFLIIYFLHFVCTVISWILTFILRPFLTIKQFALFNPKFQMLSLQETDSIRESINPPNLAEIEIFVFRQELGNIAWLTHDFLRLFLGYMDTRTGSYSIKEVQLKGSTIENQLTHLISELSICLANMAMRFLSRPIAFILVRLDACLRDFEKIKITSMKLLSRLQSFHSFHGSLHKNACTQIEDYTSKILDFSKYNLDYLYLNIDHIDLELANNLENELDDIRESLYEETQQILSKPQAQVRPEFLFVNLVKHLEHIGDFLLNICQNLKNFQQWHIPIDKESMFRIKSCRRERGGEVGISSGS